MKSIRTIKYLLLTGVVSLTLASCGGGGGGGDGDSHSGNNSSSGSGNSSQDTSNNAPDSLNAGMEFSFNLTVDGQPYNVDLVIISSTQCDDGSYTYTPTGANTGKLTVTVNDGEASWIEVYDLTFTDWTSGSFDWTCEGEKYSGKFTVSGRPAPSTTPENNGSGDGDSDAPIDPGYAPESLQSGQQLAIGDAGNGKNIFSITSSTTATLAGKTGAVEYNVTAMDTADFIFSSNGTSYMYTLSFESPTSGVARKDGTGNPVAFTLEESSSSSPDDGDDSDNSSSDTSDSNQDDSNDTNDGDAVYGWAPESISSKVLELKKATESVGRLGFDGSNVVLSPVGATCGYSYKRLGDGKARVSITSSSSAYAGTLELQFTSETEVRVKGSIGGNSVECLATLTPGSVSPDEFVCPDGGWAPESVEGKVMIFLAGNPMEFGEGGYGTYSGGGWHSLEYTYEKTGDNTAVISGWYSQFTGHNFSYTIKFTSPTDFVWSGWSKFDDRYSSMFGNQKTYFSNEEGTYKP